MAAQPEVKEVRSPRRVQATASDLVYECSCNEKSDGHCPYSARCREPLAWSIGYQSVVDQAECELFTKLPKELRHLIWELALTDSVSRGPNGAPLIPRARQSSRSVESPPSDIAFALLLTCRAVYLETYTLPLSCNPFIAQDCYHGPTLVHYLPWQYASIQRLDIHLTQASLEGDIFWKYLFKIERWDLGIRNKGTYVSPKRHLKGNLMEPFNLVRASTTLVRQKRLWDAVKEAPSFPEEIDLPPRAEQSPFRVMLARPIAHLTLRFAANSWWTWTDDPEAINGDQQLGLDPALGNGSDDPAIRPTRLRMQEFADKRRTGWLPPGSPSASPTWGTAVASIPEIQSLELVLETFPDKSTQLDAVVECAKTWKFPIAGTHQVLLWDGRIESKCWSKAPPKHERSVDRLDKCHEFEVRVLCFTRKYDRLL